MNTTNSNHNAVHSLFVNNNVASKRRDTSDSDSTSLVKYSKISIISSCVYNIKLHNRKELNNN